MSGFSINGEHINDKFPNLKYVERSTPPPEEIPIKDSVIGMQGNYDFAIALFGERLYGNRKLVYLFNGKESDDNSKTFNKRTLENWLLKGSYMPLYDDKEPMYYYMARCVGIELENDDGILKAPYTITFDAYPFKIKEAVEGSPYWDDYDISDYYQENEFVVNGTQTINFMNTGATGVVPTFIASAPMTINKGNMTLNVAAGTNLSEDFRFEIGMNTFTVTGNGTIKFEWRKEVI